MANNIPKLSAIDNWPLRTDPQERFDQKVMVAMNQMGNLVNELNTNFIPKFNSLSATIIAGITIEGGGTGATTATQALTNLGGVSKEGNRGNLSGYETAAVLTGSQTIAVDSRDVIVISTSGATTLTFVPGSQDQASVKMISITATAQADLSIAGATWANNGSMPLWGNPETTLVLVANFIGGRVLLTVFDNTQA